ncbi:MAG: hypothetical protein ACJ768_14960 [Gaiellaceae bacterium]
MDDKTREILHAVASALDDLGLTLEKDASLDAHLVIHCQLTNQFGDRVAVFSVETEAKPDAKDDRSRLDATNSSVPTMDPELDYVANMPM